MRKFKFKLITKIFIILFFVILSNNLFSQPISLENPVDTVNIQLRALFSPLARPTPSKQFLYDMAVHGVDSAFYTNYCTDTTGYLNWFQQYEEMWNCAYIQSDFINSDSVYIRALNFEADTIPIGLMDWNYYIFNSDALTTNIYFNFDTVNTILTDKYPRPGYPYDEADLFTASPIFGTANYTNSIFRIDPQFLFIDAISLPTYKSDSNLSGNDFRIDFGDGAGWHSFDVHKISHYSASYPDSGYYLVQVGLFNESNICIKLSLSSINILFKKSSIKTVPSYSITNIPGLNVGVFTDCNEDRPNKIIIYLEGFDTGDNHKHSGRNTTEIYNEMIKLTQIAQLRNFGYTFVVVDWQNSHDDIRSNALRVVELIEYLKCQIQGDEQFVVIGESMGGLVARYALAYMESNEYMSGPCKTDNRHNTRLLMTFDTPNQGANIPLSLQQLYLILGTQSGSPFVIGSAIKRSIMREMIMLLNAKSVKQMLIYHAFNQQGNNYYPHPDFTSFFDDLRNLGDYPKYCKLMALSNGSLQGRRRKNEFNDNNQGNYRNPNDLLLRFDGSIWARILGIKYKFFGANLDLHTNP